MTWLIIMLDLILKMVPILMITNQGSALLKGCSNHAQSGRGNRSKKWNKLVNTLFLAAGSGHKMIRSAGRFIPRVFDLF